MLLPSLAEHPAVCSKSRLQSRRPRHNHQLPACIADLWTDEERREVLEGIRPWITQQHAAKHQQQQRQASLKQQASAKQPQPPPDQQRPQGKLQQSAAQQRQQLQKSDTVAGDKPDQSMLTMQWEPLTEGPDAVWRAFIDRARSNLHWVLAMSPVGDALRSRCRQFPSLISCTTIDWFSPWPSDALVSVAEKSLASIPALSQAQQQAQQMQQGQQAQGRPLEAGGSVSGVAGSLVQRAAALAVEVHIGVQEAAEKYHQELRRR